MRSVGVGIFWRMVAAALLSSGLLAQSLQNPVEDSLVEAKHLFRQGQFRDATISFQAVIDRRPSPEAYAGLVQSFLKLDEVKPAESASQTALQTFEASALAHASRGDVLFRRGLIPESDTEYSAALKLDPKCARAWLGSGKIEDARAHRQSAREYITKAHELDPDDGDALYEWAVRQPYPTSVSGIEEHLAGFRSDPEIERHEHEYLDLLKVLEGRKVWILDGEPQPADVKMEPALYGSNFELRGYTVRVLFNQHASAALLLDTGSSGITISRKFAEKIGARKLSEQTLQGIGKGAAPGYQAWVDKISIGEIKFHDCLVHVVPQMLTDVDGMMGTDIFFHFLVTVDFPAQRLRLARLSSTQSESTSSAGFSPAYAFGHMLLLPAKAGDRAFGLFVLDSGSNVSSISNELSPQMGQMRALNVRTFGVGGTANSAYVADNVTLQFAGTRKRDQHLITVDLDSISKNIGTEISGQIGFATLEKLRLVINYRDGLVRFEEKGK